MSRPGRSLRDCGSQKAIASDDVELSLDVMRTENRMLIVELEHPELVAVIVDAAGTDLVHPSVECQVAGDELASTRQVPTSQMGRCHRKGDLPAFVSESKCIEERFA